jgi:predicted ATPase
MKTPGTYPLVDSDRAFSSIELGRWRQFGLVSIDFHPRLTVLTGANASGKSTVLSILARHFNWMRTYSTSPGGAGRKRGWYIIDLPASVLARRDRQAIGVLKYTDDQVTELTVPTDEESARRDYDLALPGQRPVNGMFITSHRYVTASYLPVQSIPTLFGSPAQILDQFESHLRQQWQGSWSGKVPRQALKESLIAAAVFGEGSSSVDANPVALDIWQGFQDILSRLFPPSLEFRRLRVRVPDLIVETETDAFVLDEASGGMNALAEIGWQLFLKSREASSFVVLMDEPENHLHPSLQRDLLPALLRAFPDAQFIVATHSPFVVTATQDSAVYVLDYGEDHRVFSRGLDHVNKAASADETLRRVLGMPSTMPIWAEARFTELLAEFQDRGMTRENLRALRQALNENGLVSDFPMALSALADEEASSESK